MAVACQSMAVCCRRRCRAREIYNIVGDGPAPRLVRRALVQRAEELGAGAGAEGKDQPLARVRPQHADGLPPDAHLAQAAGFALRGPGCIEEACA